MQEGLTIGEVSGKLGMSSHTLRYYERAGLLRPIPRTEGGIRRYQEQDVEMLRFLARLRLMGMPIHQIREYAELARSGRDTFEARGELLTKHRSEVIARIEELQRNLEVLDLKIEMYSRGCTPVSAPGDPCAEKLRGLLERKN